MKVNRKNPVKLTTHEGAVAATITAEQQLRRSVMACMLWEDTFYEQGVSIADRIKALVMGLPFEVSANIAIEAREKMKLRHVPLLIVRELLRFKAGRKMGDLIVRVVQRPDEVTELLALYWKEGKRPLPKQLKVGLGRAIQKFDEYQLQKWSGGKGPISMRDVVFLSHTKPRNKDIGTMIARMVNKSFIPERIAKLNDIEDVKDVGLASAETWENRLSRGEDKKATFTVMVMERKLGAMAFLRNLRNMTEAGVDPAVIRDGLEHLRVDRVLPFRFITAARHAPQFKTELEQAMFKSIAAMPRLPGKTLVIVDNSGSMNWVLSQRSDVKRVDAALGLVMMAREVCESVGFGAFADVTRFLRTQNGEVPHGFKLAEMVQQLVPVGGTDLGGAVAAANAIEHDRLIIITDEQSHTRLSAPKAEKAYMINVAAYRNGVGYGKWTHIDGWSEAVLNYIAAAEQLEMNV